MHRMLLLTVLFIVATAAAAFTAQVPGRQFYQHPEATVAPDSRILIYTPGTGSRNVTGTGLNRSVAPWRMADYSTQEPVAWIRNCAGEKALVIGGSTPPTCP